MAEHSIFFYGDSNTYGYAPRIASDGRYTEEIRWTDRLKHTMGASWDILVNAMNGREIPAGGAAEAVLNQLALLRQENRPDWFAVMLGTNDLFAAPPDIAADMAAAKMKSFLDQVKDRFPGLPVLLIGPPEVGSEESPEPELRLLHREGKKMNRLFRRLAQEEGCAWLDSSEWNLPMAYDEVHLAEGGHILFELQIRAWLLKPGLETLQTLPSALLPTNL